MASFLLRIEGVNLYGFLGDTADLNTIRGAGLILLRAARDLKDAGLDANITLQPISMGASIGLYQLEASSQADAEAYAGRVRLWLDEHPCYRHATFVVAVEPFAGRDGYARTMETLIAKSRFSQLQQPTIVSRPNQSGWHSTVSDRPESGIVSERSEVHVAEDENGRHNKKQLQRLTCSLDNLRPQTTILKGAGGLVQAVSSSTAVRKTFGRSQKQEFYRQLAESRAMDSAEIPSKFSREFADLGELPSDATGLRRLERKMAVIYLDGNQFSKRLREYCRTTDDLRNFDQIMQDSRAHFLINFLNSQLESRDSSDDSAWKQDSGWHDKNGQFQLETLLWGGDEIIWLVPAWQGWVMLWKFFHQWKPEDIENHFDPLATEDMTHAGAIVFCGIKTPIHRVRELVRNIADRAKDVDRTHNTMGYEILESFDHIGDNLHQHRMNRSPLKPLQSDEESQPLEDGMMLTPNQMAVLDRFVSLLKRLADFPRSSLRDLALSALENDRSDEVINNACVSLAKHRVFQNDASAAEAMAAANDEFDQPIVLWCHVNQLWDYIGLPCSQINSITGAE